jgi:hypothetical protein
LGFCDARRLWEWLLSSSALLGIVVTLVAGSGGRLVGQQVGGLLPWRYLNARYPRRIANIGAPHTGQ